MNENAEKRNSKVNLTQEQLDKYVRMYFTGEYKHEKLSIIHAECDNNINSFLYILEHFLKTKCNELRLRKYIPLLQEKFRIDSLLRYRIYYLDEQFSWTEENIKRFIYVNNALITSCENAWNEAVSTAAILEERIMKNDPFFKDFEIIVTLDVFPSLGNENELKHVENYFAGKIGTIASISYNLYKQCLNVWRPHDIDKTESWEYWGYEHIFKDVYLTHFMHELLFGSRAWSRDDILSMNSISAEVNVIHRNYTQLE